MEVESFNLVQRNVQSALRVHRVLFLQPTLSFLGCFVGVKLSAD